MGRGQYSFTYEYLQRLLRFPENVIISSINDNPIRGLATLILQSEDIPELDEGAEASFVNVDYPERIEESEVPIADIEDEDLKFRQ